MRTPSLTELADLSGLHPVTCAAAHGDGYHFGAMDLDWGEAVQGTALAREPVVLYRHEAGETTPVELPGLTDWPPDQDNLRRRAPRMEDLWVHDGDLYAAVMRPVDYDADRAGLGLILESQVYRLAEETWTLHSELPRTLLSLGSDGADLLAGRVALDVMPGSGSLEWQLLRWGRQGWRETPARLALPGPLWRVAVHMLRPYMGPFFDGWGRGIVSPLTCTWHDGWVYALGYVPPRQGSAPQQTLLRRRATDRNYAPVGALRDPVEEVATWPCTTYGFYWCTGLWRGRLLMWGGLPRPRKLGSAWEVSFTPCAGLYQPGRLALRQTARYFVHSFTRAAPHVFLARSGDLVIGERGWADNSRHQATDAALRRMVTPPARSDLALVESSGPGLDLLQIAWADTEPDGALPLLEQLRQDWEAGLPTEAALVSLSAAWSDGEGGAEPDLQRLSASYSSGGWNYAPALVGLGVSFEADWGHRPALTALSAAFSDGSGESSPELETLTVRYSVPGAGGERPDLEAVGVNWAAHQGYLPRWRPALDRLNSEWADEVPGPGEGELTLFIRRTRPRPILALRVTTGAGSEVDAQIRGLVREDSAEAAVDDWDSYQEFRLGQNVWLDQPGETIRIALIKPEDVPEITDVFVQLKTEAEG